MSLHIVHKQMALFFFPLFYLFLSRRCCSHGFCYCSLLIGTVTLHLQYLSIQLLRMEEISCSSVASDLTRKQSSVSRTKDVMGCHESPCNCFLGNMFFFYSNFLYSDDHKAKISSPQQQSGWLIFYMRKITKYCVLT